MINAVSDIPTSHYIRAAAPEHCPRPDHVRTAHNTHRLSAPRGSNGRKPEPTETGTEGRSAHSNSAPYCNADKESASAAAAGSRPPLRFHPALPPQSASTSRRASFDAERPGSHSPPAAHSWQTQCPTNTPSAAAWAASQACGEEEPHGTGTALLRIR